MNKLQEHSKTLHLGVILFQHDYRFNMYYKSTGFLISLRHQLNLSNLFL
jgi:hypothetical protein